MFKYDHGNNYSRFGETKKIFLHRMAGLLEIPRSLRNSLAINREKLENGEDSPGWYLPYIGVERRCYLAQNLP
jgi:hypothetical protein